MRVFFRKAGEVFQMQEPAGHRERTPDHFANGLLHWLNFDFHQGKLKRIGGWPSTGELWQFISILAHFDCHHGQRSPVETGSTRQAAL
jgi:hypothetical protein